jgi:hypothetical protein
MDGARRASDAPTQQADTMSDSARWRAFAELAAARGISQASASRLVRRRRWRRQTDNQGRVRVLVPSEDNEPGDAHGHRPRPGVGLRSRLRNLSRSRVRANREQQRADSAEARAERAEQRADRAEGDAYRTATHRARSNVGSASHVHPGFAQVMRHRIMKSQSEYSLLKQ